MNIELVVIRPFSVYVPGDRISDAKLIAEILATDNHANVVKVAAPESVH